MATLSLDKKTGFKSLDSVICIYDEDYAPFYFMTNKGKEIRFNLPKGTYHTENAITYLQSPVHYSTPDLPKKEKNLTPPDSIEIVWNENPHKCSILLNIGLIVCSPYIRSKSRAEQMFIIYHELGHYLYKTESYCDLYATKRMIEDGFNPSQCVYSVNGCLTHDKSIERKDNVFNFAKKIRKK
jgi:hypothetical protein